MIACHPIPRNPDPPCFQDRLFDAPGLGSIVSVPDGTVGDLDRLHVVGAGF